MDFTCSAFLRGLNLQRMSATGLEQAYAPFEETAGTMLDKEVAADGHPGIKIVGGTKHRDARLVSLVNRVAFVCSCSLRHISCAAQCETQAVQTR